MVGHYLLAGRNGWTLFYGWKRDRGVPEGEDRFDERDARGKVTSFLMNQGLATLSGIVLLTLSEIRKFLD